MNNFIFESYELDEEIRKKKLNLKKSMFSRIFLATLGHLWSQDDHQGSSFGSIRGISIESTARNPQKQHSSPTKNFSSRFKFSGELFLHFSIFEEKKSKERFFKIF